MEDHAPAIPLEKLVAHREWVRRVARALVRDESLADDLEQEVWLEALQSPPRSGRSFGGWLAAATKHNLVDLRRSESRRRIREEAVAVLDLQMVKAARLTMVVLDPRGLPASGSAFVSFRPLPIVEGPRRGGSSMVSSEGSGRYQYNRLPPGSYRMYLKIDNVGDATFDAQLADGDNMVDVRLVEKR